MVKNLTDKDYENEIINKKGVCFIDFYADWCTPCRMQAPIVEELDTELGDKVSFYKMNVDENESTAKKISIASIPSLVLYKDGKLEYKFVGLSTKEELAEKLYELIK